MVNLIRFIQSLLILLVLVSSAFAQATFGGPGPQPDPWSYGPSLSIFYNNGGVTLGNPTGGTQGVGTINMSGGLFINGSQVGFSSLGANTVFGNFTNATTSAAPFAMPSCATTASALTYTTNVGIGCNSALAAPAGSLTGTTLNAGVINSALTSVGTITTGVWNGSVHTVPFGGTGRNTLTAHGVMIGEGTTAVAPSAPGTAGQYFISNGSLSDPTFQTVIVPNTQPQGRLTLVTATPMMTTTVSGQTTVYYTPDKGTYIPIASSAGGAFLSVQFTEVSQATTDTTKSPAAVAPSSCYDEFAWIDAGTFRVTRGPAWTTCLGAGVRAAGGAVARPASPNNGFPVNSVAITNGPGAGLGTWVGTIASNGSSTIDWIYGASAAGGTAATFGVWNAYNQTPVTSITQDSNALYTYTTTTYRQSDASAGMQCSFVSGSTGRSTFTGRYSSEVQYGNNPPFIAIGVNSTTASSGVVASAISTATTSSPLSAVYATTFLGYNTFAGIEKGNAGTTFNGNGPSGVGGLVCDGLL